MVYRIGVRARRVAVPAVRRPVLCLEVGVEEKRRAPKRARRRSRGALARKLGSEPQLLHPQAEQ